MTAEMVPTLQQAVAAALLGTLLGPALARFATAQIAALDSRAGSRQRGLEIGEALQRCRAAGLAVPRHWCWTHTAVLALALGGGWLLGGGGAAGLYLALAFALASFAALLDLRAFWMPDSVTLPLFWLGLLGAALGVAPVSPADAVLGAAAAWMLTASLQGLARWRWEGPVLGDGDVRLLAACGALTGLSGLPRFVALLVTAAVILELVWSWAHPREPRQGQPSEQADWLPFGAAIVAAWMGSMGLAAVLP